METIYKNVNSDLIKFIKQNVFPEYDKNDKGHSISHILEVIKRSFELKKTLNLSHLDDNMIFTIASCHDNGKYIDHKTHEKIAATRFYENEGFKEFFSDKQRNIIKEAIEDHRSSFADVPRSDYGKLISSADRNSSINLVLIRSFFVHQDKTPDFTMKEFLDFTLNRLRKKYSEEHSENMFYIDDVYSKLLIDMRALLKDEKAFEEKYCGIINVTDKTEKIINLKCCKYEL